MIEKSEKIFLRNCPNCGAPIKENAQVCEYCNSPIPQDKKALEKEVRRYKPTIAFYYPVLDRETHLAAILKTTLMVRLAFEEQVEDGVDILNADFTVKRTEKPGSYYKVSKVDSAETEKLTKDEEAELEKAKEMDLAGIVGGKKGKMDFGQEGTGDEGKEVDPEDIPF